MQECGPYRIRPSSARTVVHFTRKTGLCRRRDPSDGIGDCMHVKRASLESHLFRSFNPLFFSFLPSFYIVKGFAAAAQLCSNDVAAVCLSALSPGAATTTHRYTLRGLLHPARPCSRGCQIGSGFPPAPIWQPWLQRGQ